jgi:hypothetical protein
LEIIRRFLFSAELLIIGRLRETAFTRERMLTFGKITLFIVNLARKTLQLELNLFTKNIQTADITKQAFSKARQNLNPVVLELLNEKFITEFYTDNEIKTLHGYRIFAVDGALIQLPSSHELVQEYGCSKNQHGEAMPMALSSTMFDLLNKVSVHSILAPISASERDLAKQHLCQLQKINQQTDFDKTGIQDLFIFDRGYPATELFVRLVEEKKDFLARCKRDFCTEVVEALANRQKDVVVEIDISKKRKCANSAPSLQLLKVDKNAKLKIRILVFTLASGELEILITSLIDKNKFSGKMLFKFYNMRWGTEENNKFHKAIAQVENFSGKTKIAIEQDFHATIFACNIESILAQETLEEVNAVLKNKDLKYEYVVNRNIALGLLKDELIYVLLTGGDFNEFCNKIKEKMAHYLVPVRKNRSFSRVKSACRRYPTNCRRSL